MVLRSVQANVRVTFYIFASRTDLWNSEVCLKAISRAKKSALEMKIGQIIHHHCFSSSDCGTWNFPFTSSATAH